jgi:hypothetical protein
MHGEVNKMYRFNEIYCLCEVINPNKNLSHLLEGRAEGDDGEVHTLKNMTTLNQTQIEDLKGITWDGKGILCKHDDADNDFDKATGIKNNLLPPASFENIRK